MTNQQSVHIIKSEAYGTFEVHESQIYHFPKGIIGFDDYHDYALIQVEAGPYWVLHALDEQISFILLPPSAVIDDYGFRINQSMVNLLGIQRPEDVMTFVIVNVVDEELFVNLKAPLVINSVNRQGAQHIIDDAAYPLRHPLSLKEGI